MPLPEIVMNLCIIRDTNRVLLGQKKRGFGIGRWNGYGGKLLEGEMIEESMIREVKEESTLDLLEYEKRGEFYFHFPDCIRHVHIYEGTKWNGEPQETEEMSPKWFTINEIPLGEMWPSDKTWFPLFLERISFLGKASFDASYNLLDIKVAKV